MNTEKQDTNFDPNSRRNKIIVLPKNEIGINIRDYFAAKAMQGYLSAFRLPHKEFPDEDDFAQWAYDMADAMIDERIPEKM